MFRHLFSTLEISQLRREFLNDPLSSMHLSLFDLEKTFADTLTVRVA